MTRRQRSDSTKAALEAVKCASLGPLEPPAYLAFPLDAMPYWGAVVKNRPRNRWNEADLILAATLARTLWKAETLQSQLDNEADVDSGGLTINPKHKLIETLTRRAVALARALHVHAEATTGRSQNQGKALELEQAARQTVAEHDDLIPMPTLQ